MRGIDLRILFVTSAPDQAPDLVRTLVEEGLVACGNIVPGVHSIYRWQGQICDDVEAVLLMETTVDRLARAQERLTQLHAYDVPKIVVLEPVDVNAAYQAWVRAQTRD